MAVFADERTIRPAAVLPVHAAALILRQLEELDVSRGGVWNASPGLWQRYDRPWDGAMGARGAAVLVGSIAVVYDQPRRNEITVYKASLTREGRAAGWSTDKLCDDALSYAGLTLHTCPRSDLADPPGPDPFAKVPNQRTVSDLVMRTSVRDLLKMDVKDVLRAPLR